MNNKTEKHELLCMELSSFGIKPLTNWVARQEMEWHRDAAGIREKMVGKPIEEMENAIRAQSDKQIQTVSCLIRNYPYRFQHKWYVNHNRFLLGLGRKPIAELKNKLVNLGLTPDDWPALVDHDELLEKLSKKTILTLPFLEVFHQGNASGCIIKDYFGCEEEDQMNSKTVKDFISIDPLAQKEDIVRSFIERREQQFVAIRQKLVAKGFTTRDGVFFEWNPEKKSLAKAMERLEKYLLSTKDRERFARILVAERLVV